MNLFPALGSPRQEMIRFFETHHIRLSENKINYYLAQERKNRTDPQHDYMGWLYSILLENGFDPYTNTKIELPKRETKRDYTRESILRMKRLHNVSFEEAEQMYFNKDKKTTKTKPTITLAYLNGDTHTFHLVEDCLTYLCNTYNVIRHNAKTLYYRTLRKGEINKLGFSIKKEPPK